MSGAFPVFSYSDLFCYWYMFIR